MKMINGKWEYEESDFTLLESFGESVNKMEYVKQLESQIIYHERQQKYAGLLLQSITDICSAEDIKKIVNRHFLLMKEYDEVQ